MDGSMPLNTSGIRPLEYKVLVLPKEIETKTKGGLFLPETKVEKDGFQRREGILVAMSPMALSRIFLSPTASPTPMFRVILVMRGTCITLW